MKKTKAELKIAICITDKVLHSGNWSAEWENYCVSNEIPYRIINCFHSGVINELREFDVLLWHFSGYKFQDMLFARSILYTAKQMGLRVFPDFPDAWHFDDKAAETLLLQGIHGSIPDSELFFSRQEATDWGRKATFPVVAKLRNGSGSHNVKILNNAQELDSYAARMFSNGFNSSPSLAYKTVSNVRSAKSLAVFIKRLKRSREFLSTLRKSREFPNEKSYVLLQEFIPNDGFDLKVIVIKDKLTFFGRHIRKGDFRASGGGDIFYDRSKVTKATIDAAFKVSDELGIQCMGYDFVINNETQKPAIVEMSYGFSNPLVIDAKGYFNRDGEWIEEPISAPEEILINMLSGLISSDGQ